MGELAKRLKRYKRSLIHNKEDVAEFVAKHMFERRPYYSQAKHRIAGPSISVGVNSRFKLGEHLQPPRFTFSFMSLGA